MPIWTAHIVAIHIIRRGIERVGDDLEFYKPLLQGQDVEVVTAIGAGLGRHMSNRQLEELSKQIQQELDARKNV